MLLAELNNDYLRDNERLRLFFELNCVLYLKNAFESQTGNEEFVADLKINYAL